MFASSSENPFRASPGCDPLTTRGSISGGKTSVGTDAPLFDEVFEDAGDATAEGLFWAATDHAGNVRDVLNNTNDLANHIEYDAHGQILLAIDPFKVDLDANGAADHVLFDNLAVDAAFAGREWDEDAGLYYNRARWYDAQQGRFISEDPIGLAGGDPNIYRYAGGDPVNYYDPSGLFFKKLVRKITNTVKEAFDDIGDFFEEAYDDTIDFVEDSYDYVGEKLDDTVRSFKYIVRNPEDAFKTAISDPWFWAGLAVGPLFSASFSWGFFNASVGVNGFSTGIDFLSLGRQALNLAGGGGFKIGLPTVNIASPLFNYAATVGSFAPSSVGTGVVSTGFSDAIVRGQSPDSEQSWSEWAGGWAGWAGDVAVGAGKGLAQAGVNFANAAQDIAGEGYNLAAYGVNGIAWAEEKVGILDPDLGSIRLPLYDAEAWDWSRGLITQEYGEAGSWSDTHGWSKFAAGIGVEAASAAKTLVVRGARLGGELIERASKSRLLLNRIQGLEYPFTKGNFRQNLSTVWGLGKKGPAGYDAHHVFPQILEGKFKKSGINIHDPAFGAWWEEGAHRAASGQYQKAWERFMGRARTPEEIIGFGKEQAERFGFDWQY